MVVTPRSVVLDTHVWIWWASDPAKLSPPAAEAIEAAETLGVSAISCWEAAMLAVKGRIAFDRRPREWIRQALAQPGVLAIPIDPVIATDAALLDAHGSPSDPADRIIYLTARTSGAPLVTGDRRLREFDPAGTLW